MQNKIIIKCNFYSQAPAVPGLAAGPGGIVAGSMEAGRVLVPRTRMGYPRGNVSCGSGRGYGLKYPKKLKRNIYEKGVDK